MSRRLSEPPHLVTHSGILCDVTDVEATDETTVLDITVRRYTSEPESYIYVADRRSDWPTIMRLTVNDVRRLRKALKKAMREAKIQDTVKLPA